MPAMAKKMKRSTTEDESSPGSSASSSDDISREETATRKRRRSQARRNTSKKERSYSQGKEIIKLLCKQSKQVAESKEEMSKQMEKLREEMCASKEEIRKQLEKVNQEMRKQFTEILTGQRKQWDLHTNGSSGDDSDAPRSQSNPVQPPRYRLVFKSGVTDKIEKGQLIDISVALVDGNDRTVENGPLASATVELVVVNAEFNQHNNQHSWSREDFEINIKKARQGNSAAVDVDQSLKSIVSDGRFNLVQGVKCHCGSKIFRNSGNKKVRLGVMVVSPTEERVLEGLSNAFFVRGHDRDRPNRHSNLSHNRSNTQRQTLVDNGCYQEQNSSMPYMQNPSWPNPTQAGGRTRQALVDNSYQVQNGQMPNLQNPLSPNSTQTGEIRLNTDTRLQLPFPGNTTMVSLGLNINGEQQPRFLGNTPMLSAEPSTSQEQRASTQYQHFPHLPIMAQAAANNQIDELSPSALFGHLRNPNYMGNSHVLVDEVGMQFSMDQRVLPVQLLWDRPNVEPSKKRRWNLFDKLITPPQEHFGSLSLASIQKSVLHTRQRSGVLIEPLEPDDSDEERPLKRKLHSKYHLQFVNKVCEAYYTRDQIKADDGNLLKVSLFDENNTKITSGPLSSASVEVVPLHGDFNVDGQDYWTSEEFNRSVVCLCPPPGEEASSVLGGDRILVLAGGEACLGDAFFQKTSFCARTGKFKMGVMLASAQDERVQEGISEPFRVMDNLVKELNAKDGPAQGFNPAAATLQFPRNTVTEAIQQQALIPHQFSHLKTSSGPALLLHQAHLAYSDPTLSRGDAVLQAPDPEDKSKNNTPPALMPPPLVLSAAVQASTTVDVSMPKGTPIGVAAKKKGAAPAATGCIVKQKAAAATKGGQPPLSPTSPTATAQKVQNHHLHYQCSLGEIRGCRHIQELTTRVEAMEAAMSRIPEELRKVLWSHFNNIPGARTEKNLPPTYKLIFMNSLSDEIFTKRDVCAADGGQIKVKMVVSNQQDNNCSRLLSSNVRIVVLDGDFSADNHEGWTPDEFDDHIVRPRDKVGAVLTGKLDVKLKDGEACLHGITFIDNSSFTRSRKFRLGVKLLEDLGERVQEGVTEPFTVKDRRGEVYRKREIPRLDDKVWCLKKIAKGGGFHKALDANGISSVEDLMRLYYKDEKALRNILGNASLSAWKAIIDHAKKCDPGRSLYSHFIEDKNIRVYVSPLGQIVGATIAGQYNAFGDLDSLRKDLVVQWSKIAYENMSFHQPDYEMDDDGIPRQMGHGMLQGLCMLEHKFTDLMQGQTDANVCQADHHSKQCTPKRLGSIRLTQNNEMTNHRFRHTSLSSTVANESAGSVVSAQSSLTMYDEVYNIPLTEIVPQLCEEQQPEETHFGPSICAVRALADYSM